MNDSPRKGRPFGRRPRDPNRRPVVLHECRACGAKWLAPRPVPVCPGCRCDDACGGKGPILRRRGYEALGPDGVWRYTDDFRDRAFYADAASARNKVSQCRVCRAPA